MTYTVMINVPDGWEVRGGSPVRPCMVGQSNSTNALLQRLRQLRTEVDNAIADLYGMTE